MAQTVTVRVADDDDALADETVTLTHEVRGGDYGGQRRGSGQTAEPVDVVIIETDTPTLSVSDQRAVEASGQMVFTVTLSEAGSSDEVVVDYTALSEASRRHRRRQRRFGLQRGDRKADVRCGDHRGAGDTRVDRRRHGG